MDESALRSLIACLEKQIGSLHGWLHFWTWMVILGCAGELIFVIHEYLDDRGVWYKARTRGFITFPERPSPIVLILELLSVAFVVVGIAGELNVDFRSGRLETQLRDANTKLVFLLEGRANDAETAAKGAATEAGKAKGASEKAGLASSGALTLAGRARKEADSFEKDIVSANKLAADAESHLADALQRAAKAETELERLRTPRSISHTDELIDGLKLFKGTKYVFLSVFQDEESMNFLKAINEVLKQAGWERDKSPNGIPSILVYGTDQPDFIVPVGLNTGVQVFVDSPVLLDWSVVKVTDLATHLQAAVAVSGGLREFTLPSEKGNGALVKVDKGSLTTVRIAVGKKPLE